MFSFLVRATFVLLVLATLAAFFVAQRLKKATPLVNNVRVTKHFSPNGDSYKDNSRISFLTRKGDRVTASVVDENGGEVRRLATDRYMSKGRHLFHWDGRAQTGGRVPDGEYHLRVGLRNEGRTATTPKKILIDTKPPRPIVTSISPGWISPGAKKGSVARVRYRGTTRSKPEFLVYRTGLKKVRLVTRFKGRAASSVARWDGKAAAHRAPRGNYLIVVRVRDAAGNLGSSSKVLPPTRTSGDGHPGLVISYISAIAPMNPVIGGRVAPIRVLTKSKHYRWSLRRTGASRKSKHGRGSGGLLQIRMPGKKPGVYLLKLQVAGHSFTTPIVVSGRGRRPILLVMSNTTWQAFNPLDSNEDGWADILGAVRKVPLKRQFANGLPEGYTDQESPLLKWIDDQGFKYQITTDYALSKLSKRSFNRYRAIVFTGSQVFPTERMNRLLKSYLNRGGRVMSLGSDAFLKTASLTSRKLFNPTHSLTDDIFGERIKERRQPAGPIAALEDKIGLFTGTGGTFGQFSRLEEAEKLHRTARLVAAAGQDRGRPAMVVFRYGKGEVIRSGSSEWNSNLPRSGQIQLIMRRLWNRLTR